MSAADALKKYEGRCHCGDVSFSLTCEPIKTAMCCNCSICRRKNAIMSSRYFQPDEVSVTVVNDSLGCYMFEDKMVNHYFCKRCGIYPFHDGNEQPGEYRVNLGCIDELDVESLPLRHFDGADTWCYLD